MRWSHIPVWLAALVGVAVLTASSALLVSALSAPAGDVAVPVPTASVLATMNAQTSLPVVAQPAIICRHCTEVPLPTSTAVPVGATATPTLPPSSPQPTATHTPRREPYAYPDDRSDGERNRNSRRLSTRDAYANADTTPTNDNFDGRRVDADGASSAQQHGSATQPNADPDERPDRDPRATTHPTAAAGAHAALDVVGVRLGPAGLSLGDE
jgi:type IV secretory pathway VirB10-like protein